MGATIAPDRLVTFGSSNAAVPIPVAIALLRHRLYEHLATDTTWPHVVDVRPGDRKRSELGNR